MNNFNQQYRQKQDGSVHHVSRNRDNFNENGNRNNGRFVNNGRFNNQNNNGRYNNQNNNGRYNNQNNGYNNQNRSYQKFNDVNDNRQNKYNQNSTNSNTINDKFTEHVNHDNDNDYLDNDNIKHLLLTYIYDTIELSNYKYKLLEYEFDLPLLKEKKYYISPNYNGIQSLLVFIKIKDKFLSFIVDRKTLTYNINQIDYNKVKIIPVHYRLDESIYNGTILDGVLLYNNIDGMKHFVVNDIYYFRGKDTTADKITNKMLSFTTYLETIKEDQNMNNLIFIPNKLYELKEIQQLSNVYIPKSKYNKSIKGISFYPEFSGMKLLYLYNNCSQDNKQEDQPQKNTQKDQVSETPKEIRQSNIVVSNDNLTAIFKMKKTDTVDVYNLYIGEKSIEGDKKLFKYKKIDIAYVPTKECSYFCKDAMSKSSNDGILVDCKYDNTKGKWIPYKIITDKKRPDTIDKIEHVLNINSSDH
ncbi:adenylation domain of GTP-dependent mRNA capping enzyme [Fadolivirus algeromassiliense]|jgi:hypothetical protein|uniref:Adenylation domain of GTP-dependent mRNA capping enzyme n=1 Tax=Fadolivirus FV1/VV64 TaxID=3070911 RepID=A0A7D3QVR8_9VIRU|nr:adenylation domain of GTP-dependent mRNA capping enzyme [Fadolivirus algeromassiliense]QKF93839.1 adenylation domain of GTP-dependent mRNA capping enzyme [Fadolivirus FV1/VV64]